MQNNIKFEIPFYEEKAPHRQIQETEPGFFDDPKTIYQYLDENVYGHQEFKRNLAFFVWQIKHGHRPSAMLVAGNSGEGKTETIRALQKIYGNLAMIDGASVTPQGYKGANKLASGLNMLDMNDPDWPPIYVIDEADKLICRRGWDGSSMTAELLKLMEDGVVDISVNDREQKFVSTENLSFILLGSFSGLTDVTPETESNPIGFCVSQKETGETRRKTITEDMIRKQLTPELIGRIGNFIVLEPFEQADFESILKDERYSPIRRFEKEYGIRFDMKQQKIKEIAAAAYKNQTGVRSMTTEISRFLMDSLFEDPDTKEITV